jgi:hypothetical protein
MSRRFRVLDSLEHHQLVFGASAIGCGINNDHYIEAEEATKQSKQSVSQRTKQLSRNGGGLPCGGRQPLNATLDPPNPPPSTFL